MVAHACNSRMWEAEAGKITTNLRSTQQFPDRLGIPSKIMSKNKNRRTKAGGGRENNLNWVIMGIIAGRLGE